MPLSIDIVITAGKRSCERQHLPLGTAVMSRGERDEGYILAPPLAGCVVLDRALGLGFL